MWTCNINKSVHLKTRWTLRLVSATSLHPHSSRDNLTWTWLPLVIRDVKGFNARFTKHRSVYKNCGLIVSTMDTDNIVIFIQLTYSCLRWTFAVIVIKWSSGRKTESIWHIRRLHTPACAYSSATYSADSHLFQPCQSSQSVPCLSSILSTHTQTNSTLGSKTCFLMM